jgi:hypothetical protein
MKMSDSYIRCRDETENGLLRGDHIVHFGESQSSCKMEHVYKLATERKWKITPFIDTIWNDTLSSRDVIVGFNVSKK